MTIDSEIQALCAEFTKYYGVCTRSRVGRVPNCSRRHSRKRQFMPTQTFKDAERKQLSMLAAVEKKTLIWLAHRMPPWVNSDHLTVLGFVAMFAAGLLYWASRWDRRALLGVIVALAVNWFGDSLDGTLARVRNQLRPRYGFYVDHISRRDRHLLPARRARASPAT